MSVYLLQLMIYPITFSRATVTGIVLSKGTLEQRDSKSKAWHIDGDKVVQEILVLKNKIRREVEVVAVVRSSCTNAEQEQRFIN